MERETPGQRPRPNYGHPQVAVEAVAIDSGANSEAEIKAAAAEWIANNRDSIDPWIVAALHAG